MWCVYKGKVCVMVLEKASGKFRFIPEKKWLSWIRSDFEKLTKYEW